MIIEYGGRGALAAIVGASTLLVLAASSWTPTGFAQGNKRTKVGEVKVWDIAAKKELSTLLKGERKIFDLAFSPKPKMMATCGIGLGVQLWDPSAGKELAVVDQHSSVTRIAFSPTEAVLAGTEPLDGIVTLWDLDKKTARTWKTGWKWIEALAFSPDGKTLALGSGERVGEGNRGWVALWDVAEGKEFKRFECFTVANTIVFSPDGKWLLILGSKQGTALIDLKKMETHATLDDFPLSFSPDGTKLLIVGDKGPDLVEIQERTIATGQCRAFPAIRHGYAGFREKFVISPKGELVASAGGDAKEITIKVWEVATGKELASFDNGRLVVDVFAFSPDGKYLATASFAEWKQQGGGPLPSGLLSWAGGVLLLIVGILSLLVVWLLLLLYRRSYGNAHH